MIVNHLTLTVLVAGLAIGVASAQPLSNDRSDGVVPQARLNEDAFHLTNSIRLRGLKPKSSKKSSKASTKSCKSSKSSKSGGCPSQNEDNEDLACTAEAELPNRAVLSVAMDLNGVEGTNPLRQLQLRGDPRILRELDKVGTVGLTEGDENVDPFTHYTFVVDTSGSTDGDCGNKTILQCEEEAVEEAVALIDQDSLGVSVSLVSFEGSATIEDISAEDGAQHIVKPQGTLAMNVTLEAAKDSNVMAAAIVFMTDGKENSNYDPSNDIVKCNSEGITVLTTAIGDASKCASNLQALSEQTGGSCTHLTDPEQLVQHLQGKVNPKTLDM
ncbi:MAG: hypothetical protein SGARI_004761, partial [Bacillariaceae sp.]